MRICLLSCYPSYHIFCIFIYLVSQTLTLSSSLTLTQALRWAKTCPDFSQEEKSFLEDVEEKSNIPFSVAAEMHGLNGQLPGCLKASLYAVKIFRGYEMAVRANIVAAGDNVFKRSRSILGSLRVWSLHYLTNPTLPETVL